MSKKSEVRVGLVQMICSESSAVNLERSIEKIRSTAASGAQVICLQEVFNTQYPCQAEEHSRFELAITVQHQQSLEGRS